MGKLASFEPPIPFLQSRRQEKKLVRLNMDPYSKSKKEMIPKNQSNSAKVSESRRIFCAGFGFSIFIVQLVILPFSHSTFMKFGLIRS